MIIRTKPSTQVCLRCQLRLSGQLHAKIPRVSTPGSLRGQFRIRNFCSTSRLAAAQEGSRKKQSDVHNSEPVSDSNNFGSPTGISSSVRGATAHHPHYDLHKRPSAAPLGRLYGINGSKLRQRTEEVSVDSLGRPTEVIVLRDDQSLRYVASRPVESTVAVPVVDILAQFNSERGLIGRDEVNQNIESLRPQERVVSWTKIRDVEDELGDGFTMNQLLYYIESTERQRMAAGAKNAVPDAPIGTTAQEEAQNKVGQFADNSREIGQPPAKLRGDKGYDIILRQSPWMPGTSNQGDHFNESSLRGYISESFTPKQRVVMNIIRLCWGLESKELVSSVGEVELQVDSADLDLLLSPKGRSDPPLQTISDELIQTDEEKIEIFRSRRTIRITATKSKAQVIAQGIRTTLEGVHRIEVPLTPLKDHGRNAKKTFEAEESDEFGEPVLAELARLTNTEVVRISKDKLGVHGMGRKPGTRLSTSADVARRLLLSSSDTADRTLYKQGYKESENPVYAVDYEYHHTMSWRNRLRRWARWQTSTGKIEPESHNIEGEDKQFGDLTSKAEVKSLETQNQNQDLPNLSASTHNKAIKLHKKEGQQYGLQESNLWGTSSVTSTTATVGNVLHQVSLSSGFDGISKPLSFNGKEITKSRTLFVPSTKNLSRLIGEMSDSSPPSSTLTMKFLPSPWSVQNERRLSSFPTLEMHFDITKIAKNGFNLANMIAIQEDICNDVMLPDKALDIRFRQTTYFPFIAANLEQYPQIAEFLKASQLGHRVNVITPPDLVVPIPNFMRNPKSGTEDTSSTSTDVRYLFAGLAYRTQIDYDFQDWGLRYTSINSGKADGRRAELTLHPKCKYRGELRVAREDGVLDQGLTSDYIKSAYALVDTLDSFDHPTPRRVVSQFHENTPSVHYYMAQKSTSVPRQFKYFSRSINFEDESDDVV